METNYDAIAKDWINMLPEMAVSLGYEEDEFTTPLEFGMIPHEAFQILMKEFFETVAEKLTSEGAHYEGLEKEFLLENMKKEYKQKEEKKMSLAIYRNAKMVV